MSQEAQTPKEETNEEVEKEKTEEVQKDDSAKDNVQQADQTEAEEKEEKKSFKDKVKEKVKKDDKKEDKADDAQEQIAQLQAQLAAAKNDIARAYADTENMKKRLQKEANNAKKYRFQQAGLELLPILDNMQMALNVPNENEELKNYVKGFEMIYDQLKRVLENEGIKEIEAEGKPFDHNTMQALMQEKQEGVESGIVIQVMQKGYMLKDRILRPALVKVSE